MNERRMTIEAAMLAFSSLVFERKNQDAIRSKKKSWLSEGIKTSSAIVILLKEDPAGSQVPTTPCVLDNIRIRGRQGS